MTGGLEELFRHNAWANLRLIDVCSALAPEQMSATVEGTYGNIQDTLVHIVGAEEGYLARLTGERLRDPLPEGAWPGFDELRERARESGPRYEAEAARDDVDRIVNWTSVVDGVHRWASGSVLLVQAINHSTEHRSQVFTILTQVGIEPPELSGWTYAEATGQFGEDRS